MNLEATRFLLFIVGFGVMFTAETLFAKRQWETPRSRRMLSHALLLGVNIALLRL